MPWHICTSVLKGTKRSYNCKRWGGRKCQSWFSEFSTSDHTKVKISFSSTKRWSYKLKDVVECSIKTNNELNFCTQHRIQDDSTHNQIKRLNSRDAVLFTVLFVPIGVTLFFLGGVSCAPLDGSHLGDALFCNVTSMGTGSSSNVSTRATKAHNVSLSQLFGLALQQPFQRESQVYVHV